MGKMYCAFVTASLVMTLATVLVGIAFFNGSWLLNIPLATETNLGFAPYLPSTSNAYFDRGLWCECGDYCRYSWDIQGSWSVQNNVFSKQTFHLVTQIVYSIGFGILFFVEVFSRIQMCCDKSNCRYATLGILVMISALCQTAGLGVFGWGANATYTANYNIFKNQDGINPLAVTSTTLLGFCFWMGAAGLILSFFVGMFYFFAACDCHKKYAKRHKKDDDDDDDDDD